MPSHPCLVLPYACLVLPPAPGRRRAGCDAEHYINVQPFSAPFGGSTRSQHTVTAHGHSTRAQHTGSAHGRSTRSQHTGSAHGHSTRSQHTVTAHGRSTRSQPTFAAHGRSTRSQHTVAAHGRIDGSAPFTAPLHHSIDRGHVCNLAMPLRESEEPMRWG